MGKHCAEAEDDIDSPIKEFQETKLIEGEEHETYEFDMEKRDELVFSVAAERCVDLVICEEENYEAWAAGDVEDENEEHRCLTAIGTELMCSNVMSTNSQHRTKDDLCF